jgi:hypothetical protein
MATVVPANKVLAGSNGQQIYFSCKTYFQHVSTMDYVIIRGTNQAGKSVEWQGNARWEYDYWATSITTSGWWWVGKVRVYWWVARVNHWYSADFNIPKTSSSNITSLNCGLY